jgi:hypothetical protein
MENAPFSVDMRSDLTGEAPECFDAATGVEKSPQHAFLKAIITTSARLY